MEWLAPKDSLKRGPPRTAKEKKHRLPGLTINFCKTSLFIGGDNLARPWTKSTVRAGFFGSHESWQLYHWNPWNPFVRLLRAEKKTTDSRMSSSKSSKSSINPKIIRIQHYLQNHRKPHFLLVVVETHLRKPGFFAVLNVVLVRLGMPTKILSGKCHCYWEGVSALSNSVID